MNLMLRRPLVIFSLKATGLKLSAAKIIAVAAIKLDLYGKVVDHFEALVNPLCPVPDDILQLTALKASEIEMSSPFADVGARLAYFMEGCDLAGFNLTHFDIPLLAEEFARIGVDFPDPGTKLVDAQVIFAVYSPSSLTAALSYYCGKSHTYAHDAMGNTLATAEVLEKQLMAHHELPQDVDGLHDFCMRGKGVADWTRLFYYDTEGGLRYNFSRYKDQLVFGNADTEGFLCWMLEQDFPLAAKNFINGMLKIQKE
ncbi:MAG: 3'-5' exonuclease [Saprospiraceae bacterium]